MRNAHRFQEQVIEILQSLRMSESVAVEAAPDLSYICISNGRHRAATMRLEWSEDHYVGYFMDSHGRKGLAIVSVHSQAEALKLTSMYLLIMELRPRRHH